MTVRSKRAPREWISLHEASDLLGISATTLRRWADTGLIRTFVTPGGHRRFSRAGLAALLPAAGQRPSMDGLGETPARMRRVYRRAVGGPGAPPIPWVGSLDPEQRARFRGHGVVIVDSLLAALDAADDASRAARLVAAKEAACEYGAAAAGMGLPASAAVDLFLRFRRPFLAELSETGRRRGLDASAVTELFDRATDAFDQLLVATVGALERTAADLRRERRAGRRRTAAVAEAIQSSDVGAIVGR